MNWMKRILAFLFPASLKQEQTESTPVPNAPWIPADSSDNPFGVPLVNLMENLQLQSFSKDSTAAKTAVSWRPGQQRRLSVQRIGKGIPCDLRYPIGGPIEEGMLFIPRVMEDKWVIAWADGAVNFARSWSGETQITADARIEGNQLCLSLIYVAQPLGPIGMGDLVTTVDWMMRSHALDERLPLPVDQETGDMLSAVPEMAMSMFGHRLFCAGLNYQMPAPGGLLGSDGDMVAAVYANDLQQIKKLAGPDVWRLRSGGDGATPLVLASQLGFTEMCKWMIAAGADLESRNDRGGTALQMGIVGSRGPKHATMLLEAGAELNAANHDGFTTVHDAAEINDAGMIRFLAEKGANLEARTLRDPHRGWIRASRISPSIARMRRRY